MQPALQCQSGLVVQQPRNPVLVAKNQFARKEDAVRVLALDCLGHLDQLVDTVGAQRETCARGKPVRMAVIDIEGERLAELDRLIFTL